MQSTPIRENDLVNIYQSDKIVATAIVHGVQASGELTVHGVKYAAESNIHVLMDDIFNPNAPLPYPTPDAAKFQGVEFAVIPRESIKLISDLSPTSLLFNEYLAIRSLATISSSDNSSATNTIASLKSSRKSNYQARQDAILEKKSIQQHHNHQHLLHEHATDQYEATLLAYNENRNQVISQSNLSSQMILRIYEIVSKFEFKMEVESKLDTRIEKLEAKLEKIEAKLEKISERLKKNN